MSTANDGANDSEAAPVSAPHPASSEFGENPDPYTAQDLRDVAATVDGLAADATDPWDLLQRFTSHQLGDDMSGDRPPLVLYIERAFAHDLENDPQYLGGVMLGNRFSSPHGEWPPALETVPELEQQAWLDLANNVTDALPKAHLRDLSMQVGRLTGRAAGQEVAELYLALGARQTLDPYYRASCLRRSWSISRQFGLTLEGDVRRALYAMAESLSNAVEMPVGILLQPLESLTVAPRSGRFIDPDRAEVRALLDAARSRPSVQAPLIEGVAELRERIAETDAERESARRDLIEGYFSLADGAPGLIRVHWLELAATKSQQFGFGDLRGRAISELQNISVDELGMETFITEISLPRHASDGRLSRYRWSRDALSALDVWLTSGSPTGRHEQNLRQATELNSGGILQLVTRTTFNGSGLPVRTTTGPEAAEWESLERTESMNAGVYGIVIARELEAIKSQYGPVSATDIGAHLVGSFGCDAQLAVALGEAIVSFWDGRTSDAGRAAFPLVEAGARGLLLALGDPLYRIQSGSADGRFPALDAYANKLEDHGFDIDWLRCIRNPVSGLRNALAHGHRMALVDHEAAILLRTAAVLVVLAPADARAQDRVQIEARFTDPIGWAGKRAGLVRRWRPVWVASKRPK